MERTISKKKLFMVKENYPATHEGTAETKKEKLT
jgi:hypothetical protein